MKKNALLLLIPVAAVIIALATAGCKSETKRKWLSVFFDGVPPAGATNQTASTPAPGSNEAAQPVVAPTAPTPPPEPSIFYHPPFVQHKCAECHEPGIGQGLKRQPPALCFQCHKDFLADKPVKHAPVESGECLSCHHPHQASNKKLLLKTGQDLCYDCHDDLTAKFKVKHLPVENGECLSCHNPHATDAKKLLIKPADKLCYDCHDDFQSRLEKAKVKHAPVENGECLSCHNPHASPNKKLLGKTTPALCWDCHDNFLKKAKFTHDPVEDCTSCHNPHQSGESKLLLKSPATLCLDCHEQKDLQAVKGHADAAGKSCLQCHDPHVGTDKYLLKAGGKNAHAN